jgi:protein O-mannosyl-transferase
MCSRFSVQFYLFLMLLTSAVAAAQDNSSSRGVRVIPQQSPALPAGKTYALLIGISHYQNVESLEYADKDAELLAQFLKSPLGGVDPANILLLTNERATRAGIDDAVRSFVEVNAHPTNSLIFFIAGHGVYLKTEVDPDTKRTIESDPYLLTYDSNPQDPNTTGYPMDEFRRMVAEQAQRYARVLVYVDVCHAGNIAGIGGGDKLEPAVKRAFEGRAGDLNVLLASYKNKYAFESTAFGGGHGAFSYFLVSGMNGLAVPDEDTLQWNDLAHYVIDQVYNFTNRKQIPSDVTSRDDLVVLQNRHRPGIALPPAQPLTKGQDREAKDRQGYLPPVVGAVSVPAPAGPNEISAAIARGAILPEDTSNASALVAQLPVGSPQRMDAERRLRVALEDQGQQIISRYLDGDQIPQIRADFARCARLFEEAAHQQPGIAFDQSREVFCRGRALIFDRRYADAENLLRQSIQLDPKHGYAWNALGISRLEQINSTVTAQAATALFDEAASDFRTATRYAPYWAYPVHNLALTLSERGDFDSAIRTYREAMEIAPQYSYLPYNLGLLYMRLGDLDEAKHWFESAEKVAVAFPRRQNGRWTERAQTFNALGTVALEHHDPNAARKFFKQSLADDPRNVSARQNLAVLADDARDYTQADRIWLDLIRDSPDYMAARVALAESLTRRGDTAAAICQYRGILDLKPDYAGAHEALARLYFAAGDNQAALTEVNVELIRTPSNPFLLELRGDIEIRLGLKTEAQGDWKKALTIAPDKAVAGRLRSKLTQART